MLFCISVPPLPQHINSNYMVCLRLFFVSFKQTGHRHHKMDSSNAQCRVRQCLNCKNDTLFYCFTCRRNLCDSCRKKHVHDLSSTFHDTVVYNATKGTVMKRLTLFSRLSDLPSVSLTEKKQYSAYSDTISTTRSNVLFKKRAIMLEIQSDIETFSKQMSSYTIPFVTKAQTLCKLIDVAMCDKDNCSLILQNNKKLKMEIHISRIQRRRFSK